MYIKRLEIQNFKSFGRRVSIPFFEGFTTVSGPNGSGKSNIVDAIVFCLGLSTSRAMRAERLTDLIHSTERYHPDFAEVRIVLDNSDRKIPIDTDDIEIVRRVRRTESGHYSYCYLNSKSVSLTELHRHLAKAGITPEGYNIVMQGDVTRIVNMTPTERRKIIDEIAGIAEFDEKKERTLAELSIVKERIERVGVILEEVQVQLERLKGERAHALRYASLREKKRLYESYMVLSRLKEAQSELSRLDKEIHLAAGREDSLKEKLSHAQQQLEQKKRELSALTEQISQKGEQEQLALRLEIEELKGRAARCNTAIEVAQLQNTRLDEQMRHIYHEMDELSERLSHIEEQQESEELNLLALQGEVEEKLEHCRSLKEQMASLDARFEGLREELASVRERLEKERQRRAELLREQDRLLDTARRRSMEEHEVAERIAQAEQLIASAGTDADDAKTELASVQRQLHTTQTEIDELEARRTRLQRELTRVERELRELEDQYARMEMRVRAAEDGAAYSKPVEMLLKARDRGELQGIYGTIAQLGEVDQRYALALEIAAGGRLQSIVVDSDADAAECIEYLKSKKLGRATFLPLNKMERARALRAEGKDGIVDFAINLVRFEPKFAPAFWYVFRDTLVVEDLDTARKLMGAHRMVTLDGELVEKSGAMTGGHITRRGVSFAASEQKKLEALAERIREKQAERHTLIDSINDTAGLIARAKREMAELEGRMGTIEMRLREISTRKERLSAEIERWTAQLSEIKEERQQLRSSMEHTEHQLSKMDESISQLTRIAEGLEAQLSKSEIPALSARLEQAEAELAHLQERVRDTQATLRRLELDREYVLKQESELKNKRAHIEQERRANLERIQTHAQEKREIEEKVEEKQQRLEQVSREIAHLQQIRRALEEEVEQHRTELMSIQMQLSEVASKKEGLMEERERLARDVEQARALVEERGVDIEEDVPSVEELQRRIASIERQMERLEPVNMRALEEYDATLTRKKELEERKSILEREREEILQRIEHYEHMKRQEFMRTFNAINDNFQKVFSELSHGTGTLVLENEDDPFAGGMSIRAKPANKTVQRLEAMSGGEKSLTALAFILAIQQHNPAPFYVFDEVDMFLDGVNAERVAKLIQHSSENAQFIVVSLRKPMIEAATYLVGVAMQEKDTSYITGVRLKKPEVLKKEI
ncbi:chromosome segregation protein SMC [Methermicoccus shengliensis]|uniref:Chromosome partition protein Smc n=1 Tax=Methermicoccus shengliensis TaxID=660064 RepID=A0A832VMI3_9EURY|nr:chromosome segregation protein SMC [Methermicoccus shengliensis]KUK05173.1 MAG: Chromosome partition protein Smc [Euryarchaeota archaeon 55_53]MDI3487333.1 chromosome segregation protein [Methanosarcinales archaeon]MDN5294593.1 chromosome segregation protein [Methanosarcinales archaeon]HIH69301.1 chromosome segregation protein SMC [Methermicoccus shengliensis]